MFPLLISLTQSAIQCRYGVHSTGTATMFGAAEFGNLFNFEMGGSKNENKKMGPVISNFRKSFCLFFIIELC